MHKTIIGALVHAAKYTNMNRKEKKKKKRRPRHILVRTHKQTQTHQFSVNDRLRYYTHDRIVFIYWNWIACPFLFLHISYYTYNIRILLVVGICYLVPGLWLCVVSCVSCVPCVCILFCWLISISNSITMSQSPSSFTVYCYL